ncbi:hypothetical protein KIN20_034207 [Parelaphostrongylus tenuis]|uniref:Uncharacterized protein n=1 Tax=Parelaphostrongylus tenuis TaxID=148309 RepID=A0AAD5R9B3_PARTN|nr:hypothetical protein KIN20_034207 [Parelaphostrongylus tenuis]
MKACHDEDCNMPIYHQKIPKENAYTTGFSVPKSRKENRLLKRGFVDDNNDHLCYLDLFIVWPATVCAVLSVSVFIDNVTITSKWNPICAETARNQCFRQCVVSIMLLYSGRNSFVHFEYSLVSQPSAI